MGASDKSDQLKVEISKLEGNVMVTNETIADANSRLQETLSSKKLDKKLVQQAKYELDIVIEHK